MTLKCCLLVCLFTFCCLSGVHENQNGSWDSVKLLCLGCTHLFECNLHIRERVPAVMKGNWFIIHGVVNVGAMG